MLAAILGLLGPAIPYLVAAFGAALAYFGIKHKGVTEERARQEAKQVEAEKKVVAKVEAAKSQDAVIDKQVEAKIEEIKQAHPAGDSSDATKWRF